MPLPVSGTVCGLPPALSETERLAARLPLAVGLKVTETVQPAPAASVLGRIGHLLACPPSHAPAFDARPQRLRPIYMTLGLRAEPFHDDPRVQDDVGHRASRSARIARVDSSTGPAAKSPSRRARARRETRVDPGPSERSASR